MQANFTPIMSAIYQVEGGFSNDPRDPGGMTNLGVTAREWAAWLKVPLSTITAAQMQALSQVDTDPLYKANYWNLIDGDQLPAGVDAMIMHFEVNAGGIAARELQAIVGLRPAQQDGVIGPVTLGMAMTYMHMVSLRQLLDAIALAQVNYYKALPGFATYGHGWVNRVTSFHALAYRLAGLNELPLAPISAG